MNSIQNSYIPGAGTPPAELAGRNALPKCIKIAIEQIKIGNPAKSILMVGLRGVGKTVLLDQMRIDAESDGIHTIRLEAPEDRSLPALLAPQLRLALLRLSRVEAAKETSQRALRALAGIAKALKVKFVDIEVGLDFEPEPGLADNGELELDLPVLMEEIGRAAQQGGTALVIFVDELQYVEELQLSALISALHRCAQQKLPICVVGAGLPQPRARTGDAKSYAERLFDFPQMGLLNDVEARRAIEKPAADLGVTFEAKGIDEIIAKTQGYPYFTSRVG